MSNEGDICERINTYAGPHKRLLISGFEGLPQNLVLNLLAWITIICMFSVFRKRAWNYGRIAFLARSYDTWMNLFYNDVRRSVALTTLADETENPAAYYARRMYTEESTILRDEGFWSWIGILLRLTDAEIEKKAGPDAIYYLEFYKTLIIYTGTTMVMCLLFVLPVNMHGNLKDKEEKFSLTTIANIGGDSPALWLHVSLGFLFFLIAFALATNFAHRLHADHRRITSVLDHTLMISGISRSNCKKDLIFAHFREAYPDCIVKDVQMAYDVRRLLALDRQLQDCTSALDCARRSTEREHGQAVMIPVCCGAVTLKCRMCCGCMEQIPDCVPGTTPILPNASDADATTQSKKTRCWPCRTCCDQPVVNALSFYSNSIIELAQQIQSERQKALQTPIGIAFVTFETVMQACRVRRDYQPARCVRKPHASVFSERLRSDRWTVDYAPTPNTLIWQNLALKRTIWWIRAVALNLIVFLIAFFLTTPLYILKLVGTLRIPERLHLSNALFLQTFPSMILWGSSILLPYCVWYSDVLTGHWTKTTLHFVTMAKTNAMLLLMILIMPSLGLTSLPALFGWLLNIQHTPDQDQRNISEGSLQLPIVKPSIRWECIFMPNNGSFFVNYVITATFIGSACDLARMSELTTYAIRLLFLRSKSEKIAAQKAVLVEFDFGINYAWLVCAFAVITSYSILCPLITPFGFVCLCMRYAVARYNLFFAYMPSRIDMRMHWLATSLMLGCVLMLQLNIFMFIALRIHLVSHSLAIWTIISFIVSITWFLFGVFAGWIYVDGKAVKRRFSFHPPTLDRRWPELPAMPPRPHLEPSPNTQPPPVTLEAPSPSFEPSTPRHFRFSTGLESNISPVEDGGREVRRGLQIRRPASDSYVVDFCPPVLCDSVSFGSSSSSSDSGSSASVSGADNSI